TTTAPLPGSLAAPRRQVETRVLARHRRIQGATQGRPVKVGLNPRCPISRGRLRATQSPLALF
ncbi:MAG: hypothetical protein WBG23_16185, partial [Acidobacteriaceae bacterium]